MRRLAAWAGRHPYLAGWALLSIGMVAALLLAARGVPLTFGQRAALVIATVLTAGACVRIIGWERDDTLPDERNT